MRQEDPTQKIESFAENHRDRRGDCLDYALAAAALLSDDGYTPAVLRMFDAKLKKAHAVFLYRTETGYGVLGNSPLSPTYETVPALVHALEHKYHLKFTRFHVVDVEKSFPQQQWRDGNKFLELYTSTQDLYPVLLN